VKTTILRNVTGLASGLLLENGTVAPYPRRGDVLLYSGRSAMSWVIRVKTWSRFSHVEIMDTNEHAIASRDGIGVGRYPIRIDQLAGIYRPLRPLDFASADAWFETVKGQGYDWIGLLNFAVAKWQGSDNPKQFCSEFAARYLRRAEAPLLKFDDLPIFNDVDADGIAPGEFPKQTCLRRYWVRP
jgi:hypothetical protein